MRIALVLKTCEGGLWTLPHVRELRHRGHDVAALLPPGAGRLARALDEMGIPVLAVDSFRFHAGPSTMRGILALRRALRSLRPDVVHYHLYASALASRLATLNTGIPRVHMVAGPLYLESALLRLVERALVRLDQVTVGGCAYTSEVYRRLGVEPHRSPVIPYGVDTDHFRPPGPGRRAAQRAALGLDDATFVAIMVAYVYAPKRLVYAGRGIKGHDVMLRAWQAFRARCPRSRLLVVGSGFDRRSEIHRQELLERFAVGRDPSITWLPSITDVRGCYEAADISISPSLSENHGAALEAGAMGLPLVVSDAGGLPETVDPSCGWLIPRDDPSALATALAAAYGEFQAGGLATRGLRARERTCRLFEQGRRAVELADLIERVGRETAPARARAWL